MLEFQLYIITNTAALAIRYRLSQRCILLGIVGVIVYLNVLIAIVVDTYGTVKGSGRVIVFWFSWFEFVAEVEVL